MNHEGKSDFTVMNPCNDYQWFCNDSVEKIKFDEATPKPPKRWNPPKSDDFFNEEPTFFYEEKITTARITSMLRGKTDRNGGYRSFL